MNPFRLAAILGALHPFPPEPAPKPVTPPEPSGDPAADFHAHLDTCRQCERNPFGLCSVGQALLERTA